MKPNNLWNKDYVNHQTLESTIQGIKKSRKPEKWGRVGVKWLKTGYVIGKSSKNDAWRHNLNQLNELIGVKYDYK